MLLYVFIPLFSGFVAAAPYFPTLILRLRFPSSSVQTPLEINRALLPQPIII